MSIKVSAIGAVAIVGPSAVAAVDSTPLTVTSTLDAKKALPHRIHWVATAKPTASVSRVEFLIDGKLRWVERNPPYVYGLDGNWLVTSLLSPGRHRFTVQAVSTTNRRTTRSVVALVRHAPAVPAQLANSRWTRVYTAAETGDAPPRKWMLSISRAGWKINDPAGGGNFIDVAYLVRDRSKRVAASGRDQRSRRSRTSKKATAGAKTRTNQFDSRGPSPTTNSP